MSSPDAFAGIKGYYYLLCEAGFSLKASPGGKRIGPGAYGKLQLHAKLEFWTDFYCKRATPKRVFAKTTI
jgi:hypothetical protein